jgi:hypothetical protein
MLNPEQTSPDQENDRFTGRMYVCVVSALVENSSEEKSKEGHTDYGLGFFCPRCR